MSQEGDEVNIVWVKKMKHSHKLSLDKKVKKNLKTEEMA
jgi:hypothetical protein